MRCSRGTGIRFTRAGAAAGVNLGVRSDIRLNAFVGHREAEVEVGSPIFPRVSGKETARGSHLALR